MAPRAPPAGERPPPTPCTHALASCPTNHAGGIFPLMSAHYGYNPAVTSAPLMTTVVDSTVSGRRRAGRALVAAVVPAAGAG